MLPARAVYFRTWGTDTSAYGPVELPGLVDWIRQGRVLKDTWVFREDKVHESNYLGLKPQRGDRAGFDPSPAAPTKLEPFFGGAVTRCANARDEARRAEGVEHGT